MKLHNFSTISIICEFFKRQYNLLKRFFFQLVLFLMYFITLCQDTSIVIVIYLNQSKNKSRAGMHISYIRIL